jgi:myo-inositol 2-dehydrogenase/D-chiro-inositol 1-dehydrogenase
MRDLIQYGRKKLSQYESGGIREVIIGNKKSLKLGLVGTGRHCRANLLPNLPFLPVELISVCAAHKENAEFYGKKYGAHYFYDDIDQMLDEKELDLIIASVNTDMHPQIVIRAMDNNTPLFVEKPIASSSGTIEKLIDLDKNNSVMVGFQKRFAPNYQLIKNAIEKKTYGDLHSLYLEYGVGTMSGGTENFLLEVGIHFIDLIRFFVNEMDIESVLIKEITKGQINCNIAFSTKKNVIGNLHISTNFDWSNCHERVLINFEKENICVNNLVDFRSRSNSTSLLSIPLEKISKKRIVNKIWHPNYVSGDVVNSSHHQTGFLPELKHFCQYAAGYEKNSISNLENALKTHQLIERILNMVK